MEVSEPPPQIADYDFIGSAAATSPAEIESSQELKEKSPNLMREKRSFFNKKYIVVISSSTLTITSYFVSPLTITKSVTLGIGNCEACVSCLPASQSANVMYLMTRHFNLKNKPLFDKTDAQSRNFILDRGL